MPPSEQTTITCPDCLATFKWVPRKRAVDVKCKKCGCAFIVDPIDEEPVAAAPVTARAKRSSYDDDESDDLNNYDLAEPPPAPARPAQSQTIMPPRSAGGVLCDAEVPSFRAIRKRSSSYDGAIDSYAAQIIRTFSIRNASGHCTGCGKAEAVPIREFQWKATSTSVGPSWLTLVGLFAGWIIVRRRTRTVTAKTFHGFCQGCWSAAARRKKIGMFVILGMLSLALIGLAGTINWSMETAKTNRPTPDILLFVPLFFAGLIGAGVIAKIMLTPPALKRLIGGPFRLKKNRLIQAK